MSDERAGRSAAMVTLASFAAALLYLVPVVVVLALRGCPWRARAAWEVALDIPLAIAVDLFCILLFARFLRLETAAMVARILWVGAGLAYLAVRRRSEASRLPPAVPGATAAVVAGPRELGIAAFSALVAVLLSLSLSRPYVIWDRVWHIPLVASLRAQQIPFKNIYQPDVVLHYHFSGDVLAAAIQTFSGGILHSSHALSLGHDIIFGLFGACFGLLLAHFGLKSKVLAGAAVAAVLLTGPVTLAQGGEQRPGSGYSLLNLLTLSFRPHVSLAQLLLLGFAGTIAVRAAAPRGLPARKTAPVLFASAAMLAVTDEASVGLAGLSLFLVWLAHPFVVAPARRVGLAIFFALFVAVVGFNALFAASLAPGAPSPGIALVPLRLPGYSKPSLPLTSLHSWSMLAFDLFPVLGVWAAGGMLALGVRDRLIRTSFLFLSVLLAASLALLIGLEVNRSPLENHRFATAVLLLSPTFALLWLLCARKRIDLSRKGGLPALVLLVALGLPAASTLEWRWTICPKQCEKPPGFFTMRDFYRTNCRAQAGAVLGEPIAPTYMAEEVWYFYAGCHPVFAPAPAGPDWHLKVKGPLIRLAALAELDRKMVSANQSLWVVCPAGRQTDAVCASVVGRAPCEPLGQLWRCAVDAQSRRQILEPGRARGM